MLLIENECKHCGAPMGVTEVSEERFAKFNGPESRELTNHHWREVAGDFPGKSASDIEAVKLRYSTCGGCHSAY